MTLEIKQNKERHDSFIGRWVNFHKGHLAIIQKVYNSNKRPILILVMDTDETPCALERQANIEQVLLKYKIPCTTVVIPPISSVNWGRKVGYERNYIDIDDVTKEISGTLIREKMKNNDDWQYMLP